MLFSSKISNSILTYLENQGVSLEGVYSSLNVPEEFLRDPSSWLEAPEMENFLKVAHLMYQAEDLTVDDSSGELMELVGHKSISLHCWGVLDSVLRMMEKPEDIYLHPERFLSYFISPIPPISELEKTLDTISFQIPISSYDYPLTTKYLRSALESLPQFFGQHIAHVEWKGQVLDISWALEQDGLFSKNELERNVKPDLVDTLMTSLEKKQKELEFKNKELLEKNKLLEEAQKKLESQYKEKIYSEKLSNLTELAASLAHEINNPLAYVTSNMMRLQDYFIRAQQIITILIGQDRLTPQVQEAMRRTDWSLVTKDFPELVKEVNIGLQKVRDIIKDLSFITGKQSQEERKVAMDLNQVVVSAVKMVSAQAPKDVKIDSHLLVNQPVPVYPIRIEQALVNILNNAVQAIDGKGEVRVVTRPKGNGVEIEISDTGIGMSEEKIKSIFKPFYTTKQPGKGTGLGLSIAHSIVEMHSGDIKVKSEPGKGSTFSIDLPLS